MNRNVTLFFTTVFFLVFPFCFLGATTFANPFDNNTVENKIPKGKAKVLYKDAEDHMTKGEIRSALKLFKAVVINYPNSQYAVKARSLIDILETESRVISETKVSTTLMARSNAASNKSTLSKSTIKRVIKTHWGKVKVCVGWGKQRNPDMVGKVVIRFVIQPSGKVSEAKLVSSSLFEPKTESCLLNRIRSIKFPSFEGTPKTVTYPFVITN